MHFFFLNKLLNIKLGTQIQYNELKNLRVYLTLQVVRNSPRKLHAELRIWGIEILIYSLVRAVIRYNSH